MKSTAYTAPQTEVMENRLEQLLMAASNRLDDGLGITINPETIETGTGDDAAARLAW